MRAEIAAVKDSIQKMNEELNGNSTSTKMDTMIPELESIIRVLEEDIESIKTETVSLSLNLENTV